MTNSQLYEELKKYVEENEGVFDMILIQFKDEGGSQKDAQNICEKLRQSYSENEDLEDKVLVILDLVTGWCNPQHQIWP